MRIRTIYILLFLLTAVCIFALDRNVVREHNDQSMKLLSEVAYEHRQLCTEYFASRINAIATVRKEVDGDSDTRASQAFLEAADFVIDRVSGIQRLRLLDNRLRVRADWSRAGLNYPIPRDLANDTAQSALSLGATRISRAFRGSDLDGYYVLIADPAADGSGRVVVGSVSLARAIAPQGRRGSPAARPFIYLEDNTGTVLTRRTMLVDQALEHRETFAVGETLWAVHVREPVAERGGLFLSRLAVLGLGVLLMTFPAVIYPLNAHHQAVLMQANAKLELELAAAQRFNARLIRLNLELDEFTHVVSHDLKEPLRGVEGVSHLFMEEYGEKLDEQGKEYLRSIRASAARMRRLVDDLLHLSRIGRRHYPPEAVDFNDLLRELLASLEFTISAKSATVVVQQDMPQIVCDRVRMAELFQNLLSNALKFSGEQAPQIEVGCRSGDEEHLFWVKDNGIGISAHNLPRMFQIFQRLDPRIEGSGIGLTICKRIVENHGGRIWAESEPGRGSTFFFTLPRNPSAYAAAQGKDDASSG